MNREPPVFAALLAIVVAVAAPRLAAQDVKADFDRSTNFGAYRSYAWAPKIKLTGNTILDDRIVRGVDVQLQMKGLRRLAVDGDLLVAAHVATQDRAALNSFYSNWGTGWDWGGLTTTTAIAGELSRGTLMVDLFDGRTHKLVWRGSATDTVTGEPEKSEKKINRALEKLFKKLPEAGAGTR